MSNVTTGTNSQFLFLRHAKQGLALFSLLFGLLNSLILPLPWLRWDETRREIQRDAAAAGLIHSVGGEGRTMSWKLSKFLDSGLLLVSNKKPLFDGFESYTADGEGEAGANNGFLWAIFEDAEGRRVLVTTTHMHATSACLRGDQAAQLKSSVQALVKKHAPSLVVICGDMNESPSGVALAELSASPLFFERLTKVRFVQHAPARHPLLTPLFLPPEHSRGYMPYGRLQRQGGGS